MENYYDILGINRDATQEEIKNAYRKLAKKYHPDSSGSQGDKDRFQKIQEAYSVLSNPEKRKAYQYYGHSAYQTHYTQYSANSSGHGEHDGCVGHDGCDGNCGGCSGHGHGHGCHHDHKKEEEIFKHVVRVAVWMEMEETFQEVIKDVVLKERILNPEPRASSKYCEKVWNFQVKIPANSYEKQFFKLEDVIYENEELIEYLQTSHPDNSYLAIILIRDKPGYTRQDYHLSVDYMVDFHTLVLGGTIKIPTLTGDIFFVLPPGTMPEQKLRIPGQGLNYPPKVGKRGDLYLKLHVKIPKTLNEAQRNALKMLREAFEPEEVKDIQG